MLLRLLFGERFWTLWVASTIFCIFILELTVVKAALVFTVEPLDTEVWQGKSAYLNCTAKANKGVILYSWLHDGVAVTASDSHKILAAGSDGGVVLNIPQVDRKRDRGKYQCKAMKKDKTSILSREATLSVVHLCETPRITASGDAAQGQEISLRCRCSNSFPTPVYSWTKDGKVVVADDTRIVLDGKFLRIKNLDKSDDGSYKCNATNRLGTSKLSEAYQMDVIVGSIPTITTEANKLYTVKEGASSNLECSANGKPPPIYEWRKEDDTTPLKNDSSYTVLLSGNLLIKSMDKGKAGKYKCTAKNVFGSPTVEATVKQAFINDIDMEKEHLVAKGQPFQLVCKAPKGISKPKVRWTQADGSSITKPFYLKNNQTLSIDKTTLNDSSSFKCIANNEAGSKEVIVKIVVSVPPKIITKPEDTVVKEDDTLKLKCSGSGIPKPEMKWTKGKDNEEIKNGKRYRISASGTLTIQSTVESDTGSYKCSAIASNGWKDEVKVNVTILGKVRVLSNIASKLKFDVDAEGKLSCDFRGHGPVKVTWKKAGLKTLPKRMIAEKNTLRIRGIKQEDAGDYYCTGSNSFSNESQKIHVSVFVFPKFDLKPKNTTAQVGTSLWLHCNATGSPKPKISWGKERPGGNKLDKEHFTLHKNGTLYIKDIRPIDDGKYYCIAGNTGNWKTIVITLKVTGLKRANLNHDISSMVRVMSPGVIPGETAKHNANMGRTIGIAIGCAAAYIVLVVGLMIYCKGRRAKHASKKDAELHPMNGDVDKGEEGINEYTPMYPRRNYDKMLFPRHDLEALRTVGNGSYGRAFIARASGIRDGEKETMVVVKALMSKDDIVKEDFTKEIEMLANLGHDNVVCLLGVCREEEPFYMIFEQLEKGDLKQMLVSCYENGHNNFNSSQKLDICRQVISGMKYLAASGFTHKDLAARNCVVGKDLEVKIGFLSLSYDLYNTEYFRFNNILIPLRWMPPEAIFDDEFSEKSDVWSFGVLIWEVYALGALPYHDRPDEEVLKCVRDDLRLPQPDNCPDNMVAMMRRCWHSNPDSRPTLSELAKEICGISVDSHV